MEKAIRILYLEDRSEDVELVKDVLDREYLPCEILWVNNRAAYLGALDSPWSFDLILADYMLPSIGGDEAMDLARKKAPNLPFIFLSGSLGEEHAVECLRRGATDYVFKSNLPRLRPVLRRAMDEARQAEARREAEAASARVAALLRATLDATSDGLLVVDLAGRVSAYNRKFLSLFGIPDYVMAQRDLDEVIQFIAGHFQGPEALLAELNRMRRHSDKETSGLLTLGGGRTLEQSNRPQRVGSETVGRVLSVRETTGPQPAPAGFVEGLKGTGEAVVAGRAAPWMLVGSRFVMPEAGRAVLGGSAPPRELRDLVALFHPGDVETFTQALEQGRNVSFKARIRRPDGTWAWTGWNLDRGPAGYRGLVLDIEEQVRHQARVEALRWREGARAMAGRFAERFRDRLAGEDGPALAQFLAYATLGPPARVAVDPGAFLEDLLATARAEAGPAVTLTGQCRPGLAPVLLDPRQVTLALAAVLRNAWQAMDSAGAVQVAVDPVPPRPHRPGSGPGRPQSWLRFAVRDQGPGIAPDQAERMFEPFAGARREPGRWGLGLALARAVADLHGGSIRVEDVPGGAEAQMLLPAQGDGVR